MKTSIEDSRFRPRKLAVSHPHTHHQFTIFAWLKLEYLSIVKAYMKRRIIWEDSSFDQAIFESSMDQKFAAQKLHIMNLKFFFVTLISLKKFSHERTNWGAFQGLGFTNNTLRCRAPGPHSVANLSSHGRSFDVTRIKSKEAVTYKNLGKTSYI